MWVDLFGAVRGQYAVSRASICFVRGAGTAQMRGRMLITTISLYLLIYSQWGLHKIIIAMRALW